MTHIIEEQLVEYAMGEAETGTRAAVESHLESCADCRALLVAISATLLDSASIETPERDDDYGRRVWDAIESRLDQSPHSSTSARQASGTSALRHSGTTVFRAITPWLAAAAAVLLVAGAYWLGQRDGRVARATRPTATNVPVAATAPAADTIRDRVVLAALGEHFDRTERTLVELVNSRSAGRVDISAEQAWARDLLEANRLYRRAAGTRSPALAQVLDDLEPVLLEIANSPSQITSDDFEALRNRIESRSLVFKVRVTGADVRAREQALIRRGESQS